MSESDAVNYLNQAEAQLKNKGWFGLGGGKLEEASDLYAKAANAYKLVKMWKQAGDAFMQQGKTLEKCGEKDEAANAYVNASKAYKKTHPKEAIDALAQSVTLLTERGRFSAAANNQKQIAEIYESDMVDFEKAMNAYEQAADWYIGEDSTAQAILYTLRLFYSLDQLLTHTRQANNCLLKVATYAAELENYEKAIEYFERVASKSAENQLMKFSLRDYFLKAGLCVICTKDYVRAHGSLEKYQNMDMTFSGTREFGLLKGVLEAVEAEDVEAFTNKVADFDRLTKLDQWKTTILLRIKKSMDEEIDFT